VGRTLFSAVVVRDGMARRVQDRLVDLRRSLHRYPEPSWCEFLTTSRIVDEVEAIGVDELYLGTDALDPEARMGVPNDEELARWHDRAADRGARADVLDAAAGGLTGLVAVLDRGSGATVGLRVDIDALRQTESRDDDHDPTAGGYRSETEGVMHACGHDAHTTIGLGTLEAVAESDFSGTFVLFCQPAEEVVGGGRPMAARDHVDDLDHFLALHVGLGHPTGEVVAGADEALSVRQLAAEFAGESAHAGAEPEAGRNVMQAVATATSNLYGIPRNSGGLTRVNVGRADVGSAPNVIASEGRIELEVRGGNDDLREYVADHAYRTLDTAAEMHDCTVETETIATAPREDSDDSLRAVVGDVAAGVSDVDSVVSTAPLGVSEDATYLMRAAKEAGGDASFVVVGTDHPGGHHTATFDVDERTLEIGVEVLSRAVERLSG
jgi:aminobenzoyl-glutamate utilization protein A